MPTIEQNKTYWDGSYGWENAGDEWSAGWGTTEMEWYGALLPRIHRFVPTGTILEIACGYGRWTQYLKDLCRKLILVDLSTGCIDACKNRFSQCSHVSYFVNDGVSLDMINDNSIDFVFSFDSLVHADESVMRSYIESLGRILTKNGAAFIHHSNLGEYAYYSRILRYPKIHRILSGLGAVEKVIHMRDFGVTARKIAAIADESGLACISQELINWFTKRELFDCISVVVRNESPLRVKLQLIRNYNFTQEAQNLKKLSRLYGGTNSRPE
jgi:SAM-dependent methyltransferase